MIRSILHLRPAPGRSRDLVRYIREEGIISRAVSLKGCLSAEVASSISVGEYVVVMALWKSIDDYDASGCWHPRTVFAAGPECCHF